MTDIGPSISQLTKTCRHELDELSSSHRDAVKRIGHDTLTDPPTALDLLAWVPEQKTKLNLFADVLGVFAHGSLSVEHRLRNNSAVRSSIAQLLEAISKNLCLCIRSRVQLVEHQRTTDDDPIEPAPAYDVTKIACRRIGRDVANLVRFSALIRLRSMQQYRERSEHHEPLDHDGLPLGDYFDKVVTRVLQETFEDTDTAWLLDGPSQDMQQSVPRRIKQTVTSRWKRICYHIARYQQLRGSNNPVGENMDDEDMVMEDVRFDGDVKHAAPLRGDRIHASRNLVVPQHEKATTFQGSLNEQVKVPQAQSITPSVALTNLAGFSVRMPRLRKQNVTYENGMLEFLCPLCKIPQQLPSDRSAVHQHRVWEKHAFYDLEPYICLLDCKTPEVTYRTFEDWTRHVNNEHARSTWQCQTCTQCCDNQPAFEHHLRSQHEAKLTAGELAFVAKACERPVAAFSACFFCGKYGLSGQAQAENKDAAALRERKMMHCMAQHMRSMALTSLPDQLSVSDGSAESAARVSDASHLSEPPGVVRQSNAEPVGARSKEFHSILAQLKLQYEATDGRLDFTSQWRLEADLMSSDNRPADHMELMWDPETFSQQYASLSLDLDRVGEGPPRYDGMPLTFDHDDFDHDDFDHDDPDDPDASEEIGPGDINPGVESLGFGPPRLGSVEPPETALGTMQNSSDGGNEGMSFTGMAPPEKATRVGSSSPGQKESGNILPPLRDVLSSVSWGRQQSGDNPTVGSGPVLSDQSYELPVVTEDLEDDGQISCICGFADDDGWTVACEKCIRWQHQCCYYPEFDERPLPENLQHYCIDCEHRDVDVYAAQRRQLAKRESREPLAKAVKPAASKGHKSKDQVETNRLSSYWSVPEQTDFAKHVAHFGTDFAAIANHMGTKSRVMIKNHFQRQVDGGRADLVMAAHQADQRRARGEDMGPPPISTARLKRKYDAPETSVSHGSPSQTWPMPLDVDHAEPAEIGPVDDTDVSSWDRMPSDVQDENRFASQTYPGPTQQEGQDGGPSRSMTLPGMDQDRPKSPASNKRHMCPYCATEFTRHHNLKSHLLTHSQEKPYVCQTCQARFRRLHDLKRHTKLHTGERSHTCDKCGRKFARDDALAQHKKGPGGCAGIRSSFGGEDDEADAQKRLSPENRPSDHVERSFPPAFALASSPPEPPVDQYYSVVYKHVGNRQRTPATTLTSVGNSVTPLKNASVDKISPATSVPQRNGSGDAAQMHLTYPPVNFNNDRPYRCNQCPQRFRRMHDLKLHERIHLPGKSFPCGHCDKSFARKDALERHVLVKGCGRAIAAAVEDPI